MKQLMVLIKNEYDKRKSSYWMPVWIIAGIYVILFITVIAALIIYGNNVNIYNPGADREMMRVFVFMLMVFYGMVFFLFSLLMSQSSLNRESNLGCEAFFRCQPVSHWRVTGIKYLMHVFGTAAWLAALGLVSAFILSFISLFSGNGFPLGEAFLGFFLGLLTYLKVVLVLGSLSFLFSAIFKNSALIKGLVAMALIEGVFGLIEMLFRQQVDLPSVFGIVFSMIGGLPIEDLDPNMLNFGTVLGDIRILAGLVFAALCFLAGTYIYRYRASDEK